MNLLENTKAVLAERNFTLDDITHFIWAGKLVTADQSTTLAMNEPCAAEEWFQGWEVMLIGNEGHPVLKRSWDSQGHFVMRYLDEV